MGGRHSRPSAAGSSRLQITVIIPALNEESKVAEAVARHVDDVFCALSTGPGGSSEVTVVDGGSSDRTRRTAEEMGAKVLLSQPGRARQMNVGWKHSTGDCLLFLHADSKLPLGYQDMVEEALRKPQHADLPPPGWGCFETINTDMPNNIPRSILNQAVKARTRWRHMPYGDQALFVRSGLFRELGGFKELPIMEDYELVKRLRKHGPPAIIPHAIHTSGRRWQTVGFLRTTLTNQAIILAYHCGVPLDTLASWYRKAS